MPNFEECPDYDPRDPTGILQPDVALPDSSNIQAIKDKPEAFSMEQLGKVVKSSRSRIMVCVIDFFIARFCCLFSSVDSSSLKGRP